MAIDVPFRSTWCWPNCHPKPTTIGRSCDAPGSWVIRVSSDPAAASSPACDTAQLPAGCAQHRARSPDCSRRVQRPRFRPARRRPQSPQIPALWRALQPGRSRGARWQRSGRAGRRRRGAGRAACKRRGPSSFRAAPRAVGRAALPPARHIGIVFFAPPRCGGAAASVHAGAAAALLAAAAATAAGEGGGGGGEDAADQPRNDGPQGRRRRHVLACLVEHPDKLRCVRSVGQASHRSGGAGAGAAATLILEILRRRCYHRRRR